MKEINYMALNEFYLSPTAPSSQHQTYKSAFFRMRPAPENATGEVLLSALYRTVGFPTISERDVPSLGSEFYRRLQTPTKQLLSRDGKISARGWSKIIDEILKSPKQLNQSKQRFLQLMPLVPSLALYTSSARLKGKPWNPGDLVKRTLWFSGLGNDAVEKTWKRIFDTLTVDRSDDVWARFLAEELVSWKPPRNTHEWEYAGLGDSMAICNEDAIAMLSPAKYFHEDLDAILRLKPHLTRRQWISMLESILRIGTASHVFWICHVHQVIWGQLQQCLSGKVVSAENQHKNLSVPPNGFWAYGDKAVPKIKDMIRKYYIARIGINHVLHVADHIGMQIPVDSLATVEGVSNLLQTISKAHDKLAQYDILTKQRELLDMETRQLACAKGIPANMMEFVRYSLGQRQTAEVELKGYDQGYYLRKKGGYPAAPWCVSFGPVAAITLTYCCAIKSNFPRNVADFCKHLAGYGICIHPNDISSSDLGSTMTNLGLILDSPDAEGGMMISSPFKLNI
jgi:hypothetical protein